MSSVDDRIVRMQFDNATFKKEAANTQKSLADLNKAVDSAGNTKGLLNLDSQMSRVGITASKMAVVTTTALATIANKVVNVGLNMAKALTFDPIKQGFLEYESLLNKQNVIQNATGKSAKVVKGYLNELNTYSDKTIYSFGNMTDAIQKFVNAGVPLKTSVTTIKGIANAAAFAGASSEEANRAMYAFSQSMSLGFIQLQDWNQIENANLGTVKFKNSLLEAAAEVGTLTRKGDGFITKSGAFVSATKGWRDGLQEQWATTEVLNSALGKYADTSTKLGKKAFESATQVRSFTAFMDTLKESIGSGWSQIFTALIGNLGQATRMWTGLSGVVGGAVSSVFNFGEATIKTWRKMGGFEKTIQGFKNLLSPIVALFGAIGTAFKKAFPTNGGKGAGSALYSISSGFEAITRPLTLVADLITASTPILTTFFRIIRIGGAVLSAIGGAIGDFVGDLLDFGNVKPPSGGFLGWVLDLAEGIKDAIGKVDRLLNKGKSLSEAFGSLDLGLPSIPGIPSLSGIFDGGDASGAKAKVSSLSGGVKNLTKKVKGLNVQAALVEGKSLFNSRKKLDTGNLKSMSGGFDSFSSKMKKSGGVIQSVFGGIGTGLKKLGGWLKDFFGGVTFEDVVASFNLAVLSSFVISASRLMNTISKSFGGFVGIGDSVKGVLEGTEGALKSFQTQARAKLILNIAIALLLLAGALLILSFIPAEKLATGLAAIGAMAFILSKTMKSMGGTIAKLDGAKTGIKMIAISIAMIALAAAMVLLAAACILFNYVDWQSIAKGLVVMYALMKAMEKLGDKAAGSSGQILAGSVAISLIAGSMILLAGALLLFKYVKWSSIGKAGAVLAALTIAVGALAKIPYEGIAKVGVALLAASAGMLLMAVALIAFGKVKWESIGKAAVVLGLLALALVGITLAGGPVAVSGMVALSAAMIGLALACLIFNNVEWASIAKAAVVLTALLLAMAVGATILAAFLYVIAPVAPVLILLAAGFFLLGLGMLAFAAAMAVAMTLAAAGTAAFAALATGAAVAVAVFMQTLASEAPILKKAFLDILQALIDTMVESVPMIIQGIKDIWQAIKDEFLSPKKQADMNKSGKTFVGWLADGLEERMPQIIRKAQRLTVVFIEGLTRGAGPITAAAVDLVVAIIKGFDSRQQKIIQAGTNLIIHWIEGMAKANAKIANAAADAVIEFIHEMADTIEKKSPEMGSAMGDLGIAMVKGLITGIGQMFNEALHAITDLVGSMISAAKDKAKIFSPSRVFRDIGKFMVMGMTKGIQDHAASAIVSVASMVGGQIAIANEYISKFIQKLDQSAIAARSKAAGLARAAEAASKAADKAARKANKTKKDKSDDKAAKNAQKSANQLTKEAKQAAKEAKKAEKKADAAKRAQDRKETWENASSKERAQIRSQDAERQLAASKKAQGRAAALRAEAEALDKQANAPGVSAKQAKAFRERADMLRKQAREEAQRANQLIQNAKNSAASALVWQKKAGQEAADAFDKAFTDEAQADADAEAFDKLTDKEKAAKRRAEAAELQKKADKDLARAKKLAFTDLEAANKLAQQALAEADLARQKLDEAEGYDQSDKDNNPTVTPIDLTPSEAAARAFEEGSAAYEAAYGAARNDPSFVFNQTNTSPESLSPAEIYRQTNNQVTFALDKLQAAIG